MTMDILATVAERKIREAMERGEFDDLPGKGRPLAMEGVEDSYARSSETACSSRPITPPTRVPFILINCRSEPMLSSISLT